MNARTQHGERESPNEDLLWASYLGLRVLRTMCEHARLWGGATTADRIIDEIEALRPDFVERRKAILPAGGLGPKASP